MTAPWYQCHTRAHNEHERERERERRITTRTRMIHQIYLVRFLIWAHFLTKTSTFPTKIQSVQEQRDQYIKRQCQQTTLTNNTKTSLFTAKLSENHLSQRNSGRAIDVVLFQSCFFKECRCVNAAPAYCLLSDSPRVTDTAVFLFVLVLLHNVSGISQEQHCCTFRIQWETTGSTKHPKHVEIVCLCVQHAFCEWQYTFLSHCLKRKQPDYPDRHTHKTSTFSLFGMRTPGRISVSEGMTENTSILLLQEAAKQTATGKRDSLITPNQVHTRAIPHQDITAFLLIGCCITWFRK